jgi:hypothetical protein
MPKTSDRLRLSPIDNRDDSPGRQDNWGERRHRQPISVRSNHNTNVLPRIEPKRRGWGDPMLHHAGHLALGPKFASCA